MVGVRFQARERFFSRIHVSEQDLPPYRRVLVAFSSGIKHRGVKITTHHLLRSRMVELYSIPTYVSMAWCLTKQRDNLTLLSAPFPLHSSLFIVLSFDTILTELQAASLNKQTSQRDSGRRKTEQVALYRQGSTYGQ
jgi:hypothetical protein